MPPGSLLSNSSDSDDRSPAHADFASTTTVRDLIGRHALLICIGAVGYVLLFGPTLLRLARFWAEDPDFSHGFLVVPIAACIAWCGRHAYLTATAGRSFVGCALLVGSIVLFGLGHLSYVNTFQRLGAWGSLVGAVWFAFGWAPLGRHPFPFLFLLFAIPPPYDVMNPLRLALQRIATQLAADTLDVLGCEAFPAGNVLVLGQRTIEVADACSGVRSLMAITATAVLLAYLFRTGGVLGALLTLSALPVTILVNVVRVVTIALALTWFDIDLSLGLVHEVLGLLVFGGSIACLYLLWHFYEWLLPWRRTKGTS